MPKINVYLPDDLAAAVRESGIPVSPVCQKALSEAVRLVDRARRTVSALRDPRFDPAAFPQIGSRVASLMTPRLRETLQIAQLISTATGRVETKHLLIGLLDEGDNLGAHVLVALNVDHNELRAAAEQIVAGEPGPAAADDAADAGHEPAATEADGLGWRALSFPARLAVAATLEVAVNFGHNYLGCEHLLLGLLESGDSGAAGVLADFGVTKENAQRAVTSALAGFAHARATTAKSETTRLDEIVRRLDAIERRLAAPAR
jgi:ATP-dependent Clp protease ATP-binding subunit ClpC